MQFVRVMFVEGIELTRNVPWGPNHSHTNILKIPVDLWPCVGGGALWCDVVVGRTRNTPEVKVVAGRLATNA